MLFIFATGLGIIAAGENALSWDISIANRVQTWQGSIGESLYRIGDMLGTTSLAAIVTGIGLVTALVRRQVQVSSFLMLVLVFRLAGTQLKPIFDSPRPSADQVELLKIFGGTGYPSGHSMTIAMLATMVVLLALRYLADERLKRLIIVVATAAMMLVGWSRVWSGAHWPTDVLGGWSYGIAMVLIAWILSDLIDARVDFSRYTAAEKSMN